MTVGAKHPRWPIILFFEIILLSYTILTGGTSPENRNMLKNKAFSSNLL
ncbi:MAG: hypothetical protein H6Q52_2455 [Deltaproteobacteria bacterium]|nr:hypothetical protein [Deltaproteobacteria bacterium]